MPYVQYGVPEGVRDGVEGGAKGELDSPAKTVAVPVTRHYGNAPTGLVRPLRHGSAADLVQSLGVKGYSVSVTGHRVTETPYSVSVAKRNPTEHYLKKLQHGIRVLFNTTRPSSRDEQQGRWSSVECISSPN